MWHRSDATVLQIGPLKGEAPKLGQGLRVNREFFGVCSVELPEQRKLFIC